MKTLEIAKKIITRLASEGYTAYYAGGWVRDYIMGHSSEDIDIATDASPEVIVSLFKKTIKVGMSFGVVVVVMDGHSVEVATFRKDVGVLDGRRPKEIVQTSPQEDALRRDFTINGMFYDPLNEKVIDYVGGKDDIKRKVIRTIGDPSSRFSEDRLRMIRAVRFACRFGFRIDEDTREAIFRHASTLFPSVAMERVVQELKKMMAYPGFDRAFVDMYRLGLLQVIFPSFSDLGEEEIRARAVTCSRLKRGCPSMYFFLQFFPDASHKALIEMCKYLKLSNADLKIVDYFYTLKRTIFQTPPPEDAAFAKLYAKSFCDDALNTLAARLPLEEEEKFLMEHRERKNRLREHSERIRSNKPLVTAEDLLERGVKPGKEMGELLKRAERIAINMDLHDKSQVLKELGEHEEDS